MHVRSLGFRTDLALLAMQGAVTRSHGTHLVVRTPDNPSFHWGNFLLLAKRPAASEVGAWLTTFHDEFPEAEHVAIGIDVVDGHDGRGGAADARWRQAGVQPDSSTVLTADAVLPPPHRFDGARYRRLAGDEDWAAALELWVETNTDHEPGSYRLFAQWKLAVMRAMVEAGRGAWFGAFHAGRMVGGLGVFTDGSGLGRYQHVDTHPDFRHRGIAGTLVGQAGGYALRELGVRTLVIVADPNYHAVRVYRSLGFVDTQTQIQLYRHP